jgi:hypothetical protein
MIHPCEGGFVRSLRYEWRERSPIYGVLVILSWQACFDNILGVAVNELEVDYADHSPEIHRFSSRCTATRLRWEICFSHCMPILFHGHSWRDAGSIIYTDPFAGICTAVHWFTEPEYRRGRRGMHLFCKLYHIFSRGLSGRNSLVGKQSWLDYRQRM